MKHVLVIEDDAAGLNSMRFALSRKGYRVSTADNGRKGLERIVRSAVDSNPVDLVITDILMPDMNGLELIDQMNKQNSDIPVLVISAFSSKDLLLRLMSKGCVDYLDKPFKPNDLLKRVTDMFEKVKPMKNDDNDEMVGKLSSGDNFNDRRLTQYRNVHDNFSSSVKHAKISYKSLVEIKEENCIIPFSWRIRPLQEMGGDFMDIRKTENGCDILVADVSGHDIGASYHTILLKSFFSENVLTGNDGVSFFKLLNRHLLGSWSERMITALFLRLDLKKMEGHLVSAGHPSLIRLQPDMPVSVSYHLCGDSLGIQDTVSFEERTFKIHPKDRYFIHTDGLTDSCRINNEYGKGEPLTSVGLDELLEKYAGEDLDTNVQSVWEEVMNYCHYNPVDDMVLMGMEIPR